MEWQFSTGSVFCSFYQKVLQMLFLSKVYTTNILVDVMTTILTKMLTMLTILTMLKMLTICTILVIITIVKSLSNLKQTLLSD